MEVLTHRIPPSFAPQRDVLAFQSPASLSVDPGSPGRRTSAGGRVQKKYGAGGKEGASAPRFARAKEERRFPGGRTHRTAGEAIRASEKDATSVGSTERGREARGSASEHRPPNRQPRKWNKHQQTGGLGGSPQHSGGRNGRRKRPPSDRQYEDRGRQQQPPLPPLPSLPPTAASVDTSPDPKKKLKEDTHKGRKAKTNQSTATRNVSSVDSGKGEDLSSSCESSVFEPQLQLPTHLEYPGHRSRSSSCSSSLDEEFHDALSNLPSDDDGINSSAFVTPYTTRSHSPIAFQEGSVDRQTSVLSNESSLDELQSSLQRLRDEQQRNSTASRDCHLTSGKGHSTPAGDHMTSHEHHADTRTVVSGSSSVDQSPNGADPQQTGQPPVFVGEVEIDIFKEKGRQTAGFEVMEPGDGTTPASPAKYSRLDSSVIPHTVLTLSASVQASQPSGSSVSAGSPQSSLSSHSPQPPSPSTRSQSPSPSTPSQASPSPSPGPAPSDTVAKQRMETLSADQSFVTGTRAESETTPPTEEQQEDEWPDLDSFAHSGVRGQPPAQSIPAAYPQMMPAPFVPMYAHNPLPLPPPHPPSFGYPPYTNYPPMMTIPTCQASLTSYYPPPPPPYMWPPPPHLEFYPGPLQNVPYISPETPQEGTKETPPTNKDEAPPTETDAVVPTSPSETTPTDASEAPPTEPPPEQPVEDEQLPQEETDTSATLSLSPVVTIHPLQAIWVMWYDKISGNTRNHRSDYRASLHLLHTIACVEDFWRLYNNIQQPSQLDRNSNYHFFRENIEPLWEDPANVEGGKWVLTVKENESILDRVWEELLMAMIGGYIHSFDEVNGAVVSRRKKGDRIALWTCKKSKEVNLSICTDLLKALTTACGTSLENLAGFIHQLAEGRNGLSLVYMHHADSLKTGTSYQNSSHISLRDHAESLIEKLQQSLV